MEEHTGVCYQFGDFEFFEDEMTLYRKSGERVNLPFLQSLLLGCLLQNAPNVVKKEALYRVAWGGISYTSAHEGALHNGISLLRKFLKTPDIVRVIPKRGYMFVPDVVRVDNKQIAPTHTKLADTKSAEDHHLTVKVIVSIDDVTRQTLVALNALLGEFLSRVQESEKTT